jgi:hypothetical protein
MRQIGRAFLLSTAVAFLFSIAAFGQDGQSLGDAARQARQQKQQKDAPSKDSAGKDGQSKDGQGKDAQAKDAAAPDAQSKDKPPAKTPKIITNDEIPSHAGPTASAHADDEEQPSRVSYSPQYNGGGKIPGETWRAQIQSQKSMISSLQNEIDKLNDSIHFAPGNCVANCVQWNERQKQKQQQVEQMQAQLEDQKKRLEDMQESARQQGYGSSVYDP